MKETVYVFVDEVQGNSIIFILAPKHVHLQFLLYINKYKINHDQLFAWLLYVLDWYYLKHSWGFGLPLLHQVKTFTNEENQDLKKIHVILDQSQFFLFVRIILINLKELYETFCWYFRFMDWKKNAWIDRITSLKNWCLTNK